MFVLLGFKLRLYGNFPAFNVGERPQLFHASADTQVEPLIYIFRKLAGYLPHMKESKVPGWIPTHSSEGQVILSQKLGYRST